MSVRHCWDLYCTSFHLDAPSPWDAAGVKLETPSSKQISKHLELSELRAEPQVVHLVNAGVICVIHYLYDFTLNNPFSEVLLS